MSKVLAIVDIQTLFLACREEFGPLARVDYVKLKKAFSDDPADKVYPVAYILASPYHDDKRFVRFLKKNGYFLMRKFAQLDMPKTLKEDDPTVKFKNRSWIDSMVWEGIKMLPEYDKVIVVSGNGNFCHVIDAAKKQGKKTAVISFKSSLQEQLSKIADEVIYLGKEYIFDAAEIQAKVDEAKD